MLTMKLTFLGVCSALSVGYKNFQSNMLIESTNAKHLLIDCGGDVRNSLHELGYTSSTIDAVYISHLHADHVGGLEWLGFSKFFIDKQQPELYISQDQSARLWNNVLSGGMSTLEESTASLETFFKVMPIQDQSFIWEKIHFQLIKVIHSYSNQQLLPSYGLFIQGDNLKIFISTDARFSPELLAPIYQQADLIFQDCETSAFRSKQHAHYNDLKNLAPNIKQKMWLYDYNDGQLPDAIQDGFKGFIARGQVFNF